MLPYIPAIILIAIGLIGSFVCEGGKGWPDDIGDAIKDRDFYAALLVTGLALGFAMWLAEVTQ